MYKGFDEKIKSEIIVLANLKNITSNSYSEYYSSWDMEWEKEKENPNKSQLNYFVDELVLGSGLERTKYLFTPGTKVISCFERDKTVFIDLSADIIYMGHNVVQIKDGIELLKQNIMKNFTNIEQVQVFVDGKYAFE